MMCVWCFMLIMCNFFKSLVQLFWAAVMLIRITCWPRPLYYCTCVEPTAEWKRAQRQPTQVCFKNYLAVIFKTKWCTVCHKIQLLYKLAPCYSSNGPLKLTQIMCGQYACVIIIYVDKHSLLPAQVEEVSLWQLWTLFCIVLGQLTFI